MKRGILALEDNGAEEVVIDPVEMTEERIDADQVEMQDEVQQIEHAGDSVDEAQGMAEAIDSMASTVEQSVEAGEGVAQPTAEVIEAAMEHFYVRLGVKKKQLPAMESFEKDRLASSKLALEHLTVLRDKIDQRLSVAQEGIMERIGNAFKRAFTSNKKMLKAVSQLHPTDLGDERSLGSPAWGRVFAMTGKHPVKGADIARLLHEYNAASNGELAKAVDKAAQGLHKIKAELGRSTFIANDDAVAEIGRIGADVAAAFEKITHKFAAGSKGGKNDVEIISCDKGTFNKIVEEMRTITTDSDLDKAIRLYNSAASDIFQEGTDARPSLRLAGSLAADVRAAKREVTHISQLINRAIPEVLNYTSSLVHGAYKYLTVSCKR